MPPNTLIISVAIPAPLYRTFDYLVPEHAQTTIEPGQRVQVPFGHRQVVGIVVALHYKAPSEYTLKPIDSLFETNRLLPPKLLDLLHWAANYYCHPLGECMQAAMPGITKKKQALPDYSVFKWHRSKKAFTGKANATQQRRILDFVASHPLGVWQQALKLIKASPLQLRTLESQGYLEKSTSNALDLAQETAAPTLRLNLNSAQQQASHDISKHGSSYAASLLEGVTGSGKTEVYIDLVEKTLQRGQQALVLIPEINLTPQTFERFQSQLSSAIGLLHSGLSEKEKYTTWSLAKTGHAKVVIGTRSAIFTPFAKLGLIIVDEEQDSSYKQSDGFRYSARDLAVKRGQLEDCLVVLGSATPALETINNAQLERYQWLRLTERAGPAKPPKVQLIDIKSRPLNEGCSPPLLARIAEELDCGNQVIIFQNRRGFSPTLMCAACHEMITCQHCDARMTVHSQPPHMHCHHCDAKHAIPTSCNNCQQSQFTPLGYGTERVEHGLTTRFPDRNIVRIDRDRIKTPKDMTYALATIASGEPAIIIGTQMLAKGHDFHNVTLVAIIDADGLFFSADFRAIERGAQQLLQVAGRSGRGHKAGEVLIQTRLPEHPIFEQIKQHDYHAIALAELQDRQACELPPLAKMITIRAESAQQDATLTALDEIHQQLDKLIKGSCEVNIAGPIEARLSRKQGVYRSYLHIFTINNPLRTRIVRHLPEWCSQIKTRKTRLGIDVDPLDYL